MHSHSPKVEIKGLAVKVLILVVMEDALAPYGGDFIGIQLDVLILVVMEDALAQMF